MPEWTLCADQKVYARRYAVAKPTTPHVARRKEHGGRSGRDGRGGPEGRQRAATRSTLTLGQHSATVGHPTAPGPTCAHFYSHSVKRHLSP